MSNDLDDKTLTMIAMDVGFQLSTFHGKDAYKLMAVSDIGTLRAFAKAVLDAAKEQGAKFDYVD